MLRIKIPNTDYQTHVCKKSLAFPCTVTGSTSRCHHFGTVPCATFKLNLYFRTHHTLRQKAHDLLVCAFIQYLNLAFVIICQFHCVWVFLQVSKSRQGTLVPEYLQERDLDNFWIGPNHVSRVCCINYLSHYKHSYWPKCKNLLSFY